MSALPPPKGRLLVTRGGKSITREIPKPVVLIDTREQRPFTFTRFPNWIAGERQVTLPTGDYSVEGMETLVALERKSLNDLVGSLMTGRERFLRECERLTEFRWRAILVEATYEEVKSPYPEFTEAHPNGISGSLDALEVKFGIPVIYAGKSRALAEEKTASWLSKLFTYWQLETRGLGRVLQEGDM